MIEISQASLKLGGRTLLDGFSLTLADPGTYLLLGGNGSGKSLLAAILGGKLKPQRGTVSIDGEPLYRWLGGYGAPVIHYAVQALPPPAMSIEDYLSQELSLAGGSYDMLKPYWNVIADALSAGRSAAFDALATGSQVLAQLVVAALAPVRLAVLDGHLAALDHAHLTQGAELFHAIRAVEEKFIVLTTLRPAARFSGVRETLALSGALPVELLPQVHHSTDPADVSHDAATARLYLRDWVPRSRSVVSGKSFLVVAPLEDGLRIKLKGGIDEVLAELALQGLRVMRVDWEE